jgi:hypothetical protein
MGIKENDNGQVNSSVVLNEVLINSHLAINTNVIKNSGFYV